MTQKSPYEKKRGEIVFTTLPLLPTAPQLDPFAYTPYEWRAQCFLYNPPICAECGLRFQRESGVHKFFCTNGCQKRWEDRFKYVWVPTNYRNQQWEGRNATPPTPPPELAWIRDLWNTERDREGRKHSSLICGSPRNSYPTNSFPMMQDNRGKICHMPSGAQTDHLGYGPCRYHGGGRTASVNKHTRLKAQRLMEESLFVFGGSIEVSPEDAIMQELWRTNGSVEWYRQKIETMSRGGGDEDQAIMQFTKLGMTPSVWVQLYNEERDRLAQVAKAAASMGVAERSIRIVEEQGRMLATVIQALMSHPLLALTPMQQINAKDAVREILSTIALPKPNTSAHDAIMVMPDGLTKEAHDFLDSVAEEVDDYEEL